MKLLHLFVSGILLAACTPLPDLEDDDDVRGPSESERPFEAPPNAPGGGCTSDPVADQYDRAVNDLRSRMLETVVAAAGACARIAEVLGSPVQNTGSPRDACSVAKSALLASGADFTYQPTSCLHSVAVHRECVAACSGGACDEIAQPTRCEGGSAEVECSGECAGVAGETVRCSGGTCEGTCRPSGPNTCDCDGSCKPNAGAAVRCDGVCSGAATFLGCRGGRMSTGCSIDAVCGTACSYRALAAASCEDIEASSETSALVEPIRTLAKIHPGLGLESNPGSAIGQLDSLRLVRPPCATSSPLTRDENTAFSDAVQGAKAVLER